MKAETVERYAWKDLKDYAKQWPEWKKAPEIKNTSVADDAIEAIEKNEVVARTALTMGWIASAECSEEKPSTR